MTVSWSVDVHLPIVMACMLAACEGAILAPRDSPVQGGVSDTAGMGAAAGAGGCIDPHACCTAPQTSCQGTCVDLSYDSSNCGACGRACDAPTRCVAGQCSCPAGTLACNGTCTDPKVDESSCGRCGNACIGDSVCDAGTCRAASSMQCTTTCGGGRTCVAGSCVCPPGYATCDARCVDQLTSLEHCGSCGNACAGGQTCSGGSCACPSGQTLCEDVCVDFQISSEHCGGCDQTCIAAEVCMAGVCHGPLGADGCGDAAQGITLDGVDVYQAVKVPIMQDGVAISEEDRNADVIVGHEALFRVSVAIDPDFEPREISARVTLHNDSGDDQYFAKQRVDSSSRDDDSSSTFQIPVSADRIRPETRYSIELVECEIGSGTARAPRFPVSVDTALEARTTGALEIVVVPVRTNSRVPDTSEDTLQLYRDYFMAMYPITDIELSVTSEITTSYPIDWSGLLDQIREKRQDEDPDFDVYYYGWIKPTDTYEEYCSGSCTLGIGMVVTDSSDSSSRAAVGLAYADEGSAWTMAHELGHNHGRNHAPCGYLSDADRAYPYSDGIAGVWGYDARRQLFLDPRATHDLMGYCNPKWISDYTFQAIANRIVFINGSGFALADSAPVLRWQVILLDATGVRWGRQFRKPDRPFGEPEIAEVLDENGIVIEEVPAYRTEIADGHEGAATVLVPERQPHWYSVRIRGQHLPVDLAFDAP